MATQLETYHARRAEAIASMGGRCADCGSTENLHIVKRPGTTEKFTVSNIWSREPVTRARLYSLCHLLCGEHAKAKMWNKGSLKHGAYWAAYKKKCPCETCEVYRKENSAKRRADRAAARAAAGLPTRQPPKPKTPKPPKVKAPVAPRPRPTFRPTEVRTVRPFNVVTDLAHLNGRKFPSVIALREALKRTLQKHLGSIPPANGPDRLYDILVQNEWVAPLGNSIIIKLPSLKSDRQIWQERRETERQANADLLAASEVLNAQD